MKRLMMFLAFILPLGLFAQDEKDYYQVEVLQFTPDFENLAELTKKMADHNKKYHAPGDYSAAVFNITTGPNIGDLIWLMGPTTYTELDARPGDDGHDEDWRDNIMPHIEEYKNGEYWRRDANFVIDNRDNKDRPMNMYRLRYFTVNWGQGDNVDALMSRVKETLEQVDGVDYWALYSNEFIQGRENGRHLAVVSGFNSLSELDDDSWDFVEEYEELYGEGTWEYFMSDMNNTFENWWDEWWVLNPKMSGMED